MKFQDPPRGNFTRCLELDYRVQEPLVPGYKSLITPPLHDLTGVNTRESRHSAYHFIITIASSSNNQKKIYNILIQTQYICLVHNKFEGVLAQSKVVHYSLQVSVYVSSYSRH